MSYGLGSAEYVSKKKHVVTPPPPDGWVCPDLTSKALS